MISFKTFARFSIKVEREEEEKLKHLELTATSPRDFRFSFVKENLQSRSTKNRFLFLFGKRSRKRTAFAIDGSTIFNFQWRVADDSARFS